MGPTFEMLKKILTMKNLTTRFYHFKIHNLTKEINHLSSGFGKTLANFNKKCTHSM